MKLGITEDPQWVAELRRDLEPSIRAIVEGPLFAEMAAGTLSLSRFRGALLYFYPLVEDFPKYMALSLTKVPPGDGERNRLARDWLLENMNIERRHAVWYRNWAVDFGVEPSSIAGQVMPPAAMDAVNNYLWRIVSGGSLSEALAAVNLGIEGPTGVWTERVEEGIRAYAEQPGIVFRSGTLTWLKAHAAYDDTHPDEAIELIKRFAVTAEEQEAAKRAAERSMAYYAMAADACYTLFG